MFSPIFYLVIYIGSIDGTILQRHVEALQSHTSSTYRPSRDGQKKIEWKDIHQQAFDGIKKVMAKETILNNQNLIRPLGSIHMLVGGS